MFLLETLTALASIVAGSLVVRMVKRQVRKADPQGPITVTRKGSNKSVTLPAHYDPAAVTAFLEMTA